MWEETAHPRGKTGSPVGGEFVAASSSGSKPAARSKKAMLKSGGGGRKAGRGPLGFNGKTGTGYGRPGGDPRVKQLQTALNRLGLKDSKGHALQVDGKLGPLTTSSVMAAQRRLGVPATGKVTPALLAQLTKAKGLGNPKAMHRRTHLAGKRPLKKTSAGKKPAAKARPKPTPRPLPPGVQRAIARIPADQRK